MLVFFRAEDGEGTCSNNDLCSQFQQCVSRKTSAQEACLDPW
jgi:hypothetical protein